MIAFPHSNPKLQAQGFGRFATGGRNGKVIFIDRLDDPTLDTATINAFEAAKSGSLRWAFTRTYPRIVIPKIAGYVDLQDSNVVIGAGTSDFTYLGFLAPGDGIVVKNRPIRIFSVSNLIIRGLKARLGDLQSVEGTPLGGGFDPPLQNIIIDRCSVAWGTDQTLSPANAENITIQYTIISETLNDSVHVKGPHSFNTLFSGDNYSLHNCLITSGTNRNPLWQNPIRTATGERYWANPLFDQRNCVIFNNGVPCELNADIFRINIVRNLYESGPYTDSVGRSHQVCIAKTNTRDVSTIDINESARAYMYGNRAYGNPNVAYDSVSQKALGFSWDSIITNAFRDTLFVNDEFAIPVDTYAYDTKAETDQQIRDRIRDFVGYPVRDSVDLRIISQWQNASENSSGIWSTTPPFAVGSKTGLTGIIDSQNDVGGFPALTGGVYPTSTANDGIPDTWKIANGLDINIDYGIAGTPISHPYLFAPSGYRWVEEYSFSLLEDVTPATYNLTVQSSNPTFGTVSKSLSNPVTAGATDVLTATPVGTGVFQGWYLGSVSFANLITTDNPYSRVVNSDATIIASFIDSTPIPPEQPRKKWAKKRPVL